MLKKIALLYFYCFCSILIAQQDSLSFKNGTDNPNILTTHHFGIFSSRINTNFKFTPYKTPTFSINSVSGNNFHPLVAAFFPKDPKVREALSKIHPLPHIRVGEWLEDEQPNLFAIHSYLIQCL